jgi:hypothetical protein
LRFSLQELEPFSGVPLTSASSMSDSSRPFIIDLTASESDLPSRRRPTTNNNLAEERELVEVCPISLLTERRTERLQPVPRSLEQDDDVVVLRAVRSKKPAPASKQLKPVVISVTDTPVPSSASETKKCPICLDPLSQPSVTICGHIFCTSCLSAAIKEHQICPICRKKLPRKNGHHAIFF